MKQELSVAEGLIFREHPIVLPLTLERKVVRLGHSLGHLGKTKTKQMLREKYWFPQGDQHPKPTLGHSIH